ncbi:toll/interleukin-1 receptor domain-containing protein [Maribacter dokdonensis]|uniref:toll/interleukin-1 receptor domain-containing protein n=1 Tax=Maribacter dokdonensis TaxID=320912 RepID=UPI0007199415|nr:toll/interleukin-1 receptor domain-containing protein [Maribacter dokdonensis]KSA13471.1 SEFIR domain protein [Maribacter dokdonensis DSW-8]
MSKRKTVFISYSWDSEEHKEWVLKLANYLIEKAGCNVLLDQFDLAVGKELTHFMENGLEKADKVLIILTEDYKRRADARTGGTGFEYSLISQGLYDLQASNDKFIPVLRKGTKQTSAPTYLATKIYHSMKDDAKFEMDAFKLSREIYEKPEIVKPEPGAIPDFDNPDYDPIIAVANQLSSQEKLNEELDAILKSTAGVQLAQEEFSLLYKKIKDRALKYSQVTNFQFKTEDKVDAILISSHGYTVTFFYRKMASNWAKENTLTCKMWNGYISLNQRHYFDHEKPKRVKEINTKVDLDENKNVVWRVDENRVLNSEDLVQAAFVFIMESIQKEKEPKFRKGK